MVERFNMAAGLRFSRGFSSPRSSQPYLISSFPFKQVQIFYTSFPLVKSKPKEGPAGRTPELFGRANHGHFSQVPPQLYNTFIEDVFLRECLSQRLPAEVRLWKFEGTR